MTVSIRKSSKFNHARVQYFAEAGGHTLLRLTCGSRGGEVGGAIKTATARDPGFAPVCSDREKLFLAMKNSVQTLGDNADNVSLELDGKRRAFGEITLKGSEEELVEVLRALAKEMEFLIAQPRQVGAIENNFSLSDLYTDLCVQDGMPVYLSDGVYLEADGRMFE